MTQIEAERDMTRSEIAEYFHEFARQIDTSEGVSDPRARQGEDDGRVTFMVGDDSATINPPETVAFTVDIESDSSFLEAGRTHEVGFELAWQAEATDEGEQEATDFEIR